MPERTTPTSVRAAQVNRTIAFPHSQEVVGRRGGHDHDHPQPPATAGRASGGGNDLWSGRSGRDGFAVFVTASLGRWRRGQTETLHDFRPRLIVDVGLLIGGVEQQRNFPELDRGARRQGHIILDAIAIYESAVS